VGLVAITVLVTVWLTVQLAFRRSLGEAARDPDALAGRLGCNGCGVRDCDERRHPEAALGAEEDSR
jgi:hypothetical protein